MTAESTLLPANPGCFRSLFGTTVLRVLTGIRHRRSGSVTRLFDDGFVGARVRHWPHRPDVAHLVLIDHTAAPSLTSLQEWIESLRLDGYGFIRTGAVSAAAAKPFELSGFVDIQHLALLRLSAGATSLLARSTPHHEIRTLRTQRSLSLAARLDQMAFASGWELDVEGIEEACRATPAHRLRLAVTATDEPAGYMITGRNGTAGFVQRLAVDPKFEGQGVATSLLQDGLSWLKKRQVSDILVNTHLDNHRALALYQRLGFEQLPENLQVLELRITGSAPT